MPSAIGSFAEQPHAPPTPPQPAPALLRPLAPPPPPAPAWADVPLQLALFELPEPLQDVILGHLGLGDLATASCASLAFAALCRRALELKREVAASTDLRLLPRQLNLLLLGAGGASGAASHRLHRRSLAYVPAALHYISQHCRCLQRLHLELPPPQVPLAAAADAVARALSGEPWQPAAALAAAVVDSECPPVDGYLLKLVAQSCPDLRSLRLVNLSNTATCNRLVRPNDAVLCVLARSCPQLEELVVGHRGGEDCMFNASSPYYLDDVGDLGMAALARHCTGLRRLGLLRCSRVGDGGLAVVVQRCRQLTALVLHDCPGISERGMLTVGERCAQLRVLDCCVARRPPVGLLLGGEEPEQLGFRPLFTIAANCPLLEDVCISEESLEAPVVDDDCLLCLAQGCLGLRRLALRHCGGVTDSGLRSVAMRCKQLQDLVLEHTAVGDEGVLHAARGLPCLRSLAVANLSSSLGHLAYLSTGQRHRVWGVGDAALQHIATHCAGLRELSLVGSRRVTDAGLGRLASSPSLAAQLTSLTVSHTAATDGSICELLARCSGLRALAVRGLLFNADSTAARLASNCRHLISLDLRHCSTLSDAGLAQLGRLPFLRSLALSFCVRITDAGLTALARADGAAACDAGPAGAAAARARGPPLPAVEGSAAAMEPGDGGLGAAEQRQRQRACLLQELELYHVPQVTHRGIWALVEASPHMQHINIGKCRLVRVESLRPLVERRRLRLSACHYLDS
ncbi:F-box LRR-repeat 4 [Micractinium conductrix]|uniref:F-box LRR-repeat 4 n=1 Tax=Micractinium conductrix TaxID=554055 RepID=A0A2P6VK61_9CHLO|nr:F-box LRR-repeat 4 [Micractinium conductrix]|eukprot:PSC74491.1 F-box LRR-repeat 4 [Micractinium conductrix]